MSETIVDLNFLEAGVQCFPMYHYEERKIESKTLFDDAEDTIQIIIFVVMPSPISFQNVVAKPTVHM